MEEIQKDPEPSSSSGTLKKPSSVANLRIAQLFYEHNLSLDILNSPSWFRFVDALNPGYSPPDPEDVKQLLNKLYPESSLSLSEEKPPPLMRAKDDEEEENSDDADDDNRDTDEENLDEEEEEEEELSDYGEFLGDYDIRCGDELDGFTKLVFEAQRPFILAAMERAMGMRP